MFTGVTQGAGVCLVGDVVPCRRQSHEGVWHDLVASSALT
jgi:hypothetical protein